MVMSLDLEVLYYEGTLQRYRIYPCARTAVWGNFCRLAIFSHPLLGEISPRTGKFFILTADSAPLVPSGSQVLYYEGTSRSSSAIL
jgi:hypothetical protein